MRFPIVCIGLLLRAFSGFTQSPAIYDVVIHEIMVKPGPPLGLPPYEYIELKNISTAPVQLKDWRIAVNKREIILPACLLQPDSLLLLCATAAVPSYRVPNIRGIDRFPALADDSALVVLYDAHRRVMHAVDYDAHWYGTPSPPKGGISLEMINDALPCSGKINWTASTAVAGGTPGNPNAVAQPLPDNTRPDLRYATITDSLHVLLGFSKTLDSAVAADPAHYHFNNGLQVTSSRVLPPLFRNVVLQLSIPLSPGEIYTLTTMALTDCMGESSGLNTSLSIGIPQLPEKQEVVINEVLFDPGPGSPEFIELYNGSQKVVELASLRLCNRKADGSLGPWKILSSTGRLLMPGQPLALTTDAVALSNYYPRAQPENIQTVGSLPSMPATEGSIVLLRTDSALLDELHYTRRLHFPLARELQGVSLERLSYSHPSDDVDNWHSAATAAGNATPGAINSQRWPDAGDSLNIVLAPGVFSPNQDGIDDWVRLSWTLPGPGYVGNIVIYDIQGRPVRWLARNFLLGNNGYLQWDGKNENAVLLPSGIYIFLIEIFNLPGQVKRCKRTVVMARKLN
ncbi:lamin tail domain-containing protein [Chitinophaga sp. Ak27]|uniref:lamin tail domain-containing protein n=1 Tax=Chitinophaga sp. Ak27 TaxID=2726116 RepID=UPI00145C8083|nr:lamin tail domain-containing protein [Chitinophaga sp. Ak27]NLU93986.1 hypothetical protein [Chitinophaga sp. Ak27]